MRGAILLLPYLITAVPGTLLAQRLLPNPFPRADMTVAAPSRVPAVGVPRTDLDTPKLVFAGLIGAATGFVAGAFAFQRRSCEGEGCWLPAFYAAIAGQGAGVPLGVHLANGTRGRYGPALAASLAIGGLGLGAAILTDKPGLLLAIPVLQIASSIGIEGATSGERP